MKASQIYILISVIVLLIIAILFIFVAKKKKEKKLTPLAGLAFAFLLTGILLGDSRLISYGLMEIGAFIAIIDIFKKRKKE